MSEVSKPHSVLDDLNGLREEAEEAHNRYHDWKKVPYWDCPLEPCSWFNNDLPLIETQIRSLFEQLEAAQRILVEERRWISDARNWYRDHRSSKGGIYDENTWGDPFAVPGEAGALPPSLVASGADASPPAPSPDIHAVAEGYRRDQGEP